MQKSPWGTPKAARATAQKAESIADPRTCKRCGAEKTPLKNGYSYCKSCTNAARRQARSGKPRIDGDPLAARAWHLRRTYGITLAQYDELLIAQGGLCALCKRPQLKACGRTGAKDVERMHVDHDHKSGKIRGLLCALCNRGLGCFSEDPDLLEWAAAYLRSHCSESEWMLPA
jgi:hypothetical protein